MKDSNSKQNKLRLSQHLQNEFAGCGVSRGEIAEVVVDHYKDIRSAKANVRNFLTGVCIISPNDYDVIKDHLLKLYKWDLRLTHRELRRKFNCLKEYQRGAPANINIRTSKKRFSILQNYTDSIGVTKSSFINLLIDNWIEANKTKNH